MEHAEIAPPWAVLVPLKPLTAAKSRLDRPDRGVLALAMALDTTTAALDAGGDVVGAVIVVTDDLAARAALHQLALAHSGSAGSAFSTGSAGSAFSTGSAGSAFSTGSAGDGPTGRLLVVTDEPKRGLNPAFAHAATLARRLHPGWGTVALAADLPALRPQELRRALSGAQVTGRGVLADAAGTGTVLLSATAGTELRPEFGAGSFAAHRRSGATDLTVLLADQVPGLRRDVDTVSDLAAARALGLGPATTRALAAAPSPRSAA